MLDDNPYAAGDAGHIPGGTVRLVVPAAFDVAAARAALTGTTGDPQWVAMDRRAAGPRVRRLAVWLAGLGAVAFLGALAAIPVVNSEDEAIGVVMVATLCALVALVGAGVVYRDRKLVERGAEHTASQAASAFWHALVARPAFALSLIAPAAREEEVEAPHMGNIPTTPGTFAISDRKLLRKWAQASVIPGGGTYRVVRPKSSSVVSHEGDAALTSTTLTGWSMPQWAVIVTVVSFVLVRLLGLIVGLILFFSMRKRQEVVIEQQWLKGVDGAWYLATASTHRP